MILKASQRGGAKQLGLHLLKTEENEHVEVHEVRGFVSEDVVGALREAYAVSRGTRCKQFLFSVSMNPPQTESVGVDTFEDTANRIEDRTGLSGHPRVIVFHEKEGRRHAHCVWSRIDTDSMTAVNLSHFKNKLRDISKELYLENDWQMPRGFIDSQARDPRNFTLAEWQQAKRMSLHGRDLKAMMQECWAASDSRAAFEHALGERGILLAKGDRRGHVAVTHDGEVMSVARYVDKKAKDVRARLGDPNELPSVEDAKKRMALDMGTAFQRHVHEARAKFSQEQATLDARRQTVTATHELERQKLDTAQRERLQKETAERLERFNKGFRGLWDRMTGKHARLAAENEKQALVALQRDREQRDRLVEAQLKERLRLQQSIQAERERQAELLLDLRSDRKKIEQSLEPPEKRPVPPSPEPEQSPVTPPVKEPARPQPEPSNPESFGISAQDAFERATALRDRPPQNPEQSAGGKPQPDLTERIQELREPSSQPQRAQGPERERD